MEKSLVHNLIILDESGSMGSIKNQIISGFNETVQGIRNAQKKFDDQEHFVTLLSFNGAGRKLLHFCNPVLQLEEINGELYQPDDTTPLFDAIGHAISKLKTKIGDANNGNVLVTILTDGEENSSKEFSGKAVKRMIEELKEKNWTFTYIGTDHDVNAIALQLSITNTLIFEKNKEGIDNMFLKERSARDIYYQKIRSNEDTKGDFFNED